MLKARRNVGRIYTKSEKRNITKWKEDLPRRNIGSGKKCTKHKPGAAPTDNGKNREVSVAHANHQPDPGAKQSATGKASKRAQPAQERGLSAQTEKDIPKEWGRRQYVQGDTETDKAHEGTSPNGHKVSET